MLQRLNNDSTSSTSAHDRSPYAFQIPTRSMSHPTQPVAPSSALPASDKPSKLAFAHQGIEDHLQCPVCIDRLRKPRALPCQHVFCLPCLTIIARGRTVLCPLCRQAFPYIALDQFPTSYIHSQLLDLVPVDYGVTGKCTRCSERHPLNLCSCCDYLLCARCLQADRDTLLAHIRQLVTICSSHLERVHRLATQCDSLPISSWSYFNLNNILHQATVLMNDPQKIEPSDIIASLAQLRSLQIQLEQDNQLPIHRSKRTLDDDDIQEILPPIKEKKVEPISWPTDDKPADDDDDDDLIYLETIERTVLTECIEILSPVGS